MRSLIACAVILFAGQLSFAGTITHYDIDAQILPKTAELRAEVALTCKAPEGGLQQMELLLNHSLDVRSVSSDAGVKMFRFDRTQASSFRYTPTASPLLVEFSNPVEAGKTFVIRLSYEGKIDPDKYLTNLITPDWVELGLYAAWYPIDPNSTSITSNVKVKVEEPYVVTGTGVASRAGDSWVLTQDSATFDMVVIAAPNLRVSRVGKEGAGVEVWSRKLDEQQVDQIAGDVAKTMSLFQSWFGPSTNGILRMVFADRTSGGGYYRLGFMSILYDNDYRGLVKYAAHELGHFWWCRGSTTTWEDWLNESFAEYSSLLLLREFYGPDAYAEFLRGYQKEAEKVPAIWGLDRNDQAAHVVLYKKGAVLLGGLESKIGKEAFGRFLAALVERKVGSTEQLLATLEELTSKPIRDSFEQSLRQ